MKALMIQKYQKNYLKLNNENLLKKLTEEADEEPVTSDLAETDSDDTETEPPVPEEEDEYLIGTMPQFTHSAEEDGWAVGW